MHMVHLSGNTSGVLKSSSDWLNYTEFPGDVCVAFLNVPPGNKNAVAPNPLTKLTTSACQDQLNAEFSKVCENFKVRGIESYPRVLHTGLLLWQHFHAPKHDCGTKRNVIGCFTCQSYGLLGGPWPSKVPRPSAVSLKVWISETSSPASS